MSIFFHNVVVLFHRANSHFRNHDVGGLLVIPNPNVTFSSCGPLVSPPFSLFFLKCDISFPNLELWDLVRCFVSFVGLLGLFLQMQKLDDLFFYLH
jgi:hypothetical protein